MASVITTEGLEWFAEKAVDQHEEQLYYLAVGNGTTDPSGNDTSLDGELYRENISSDTVSISKSSNVGEVNCRISVTGGVEVPGNSDISEFGLFSDRTQVLIYRETRSDAVTIENGDTKSFQWSIKIED